MSEFSVGNGAWVLVGDGRRALFFQNHGDAELLDLRVVETRVDDNPPTHEQGTDRPGRSFTSFSPGRSAMQNTDWHELEEERFARAMADRINQAAESGELDAIAIIAPPKALGEIRKELSVKAQSKVVGELAKDLTRHPLKDIEKALTRG
ncbi:host attachment family protein [Methylocystis sp. SB2]|uniref:baeRF12 domain-containing protein n=1 Tax=Methylocystis sp. (strain SB2) TaxID=743836 RepID=UPI0004034578|nr:host attachment family protein [Methylocystis sp. SB2]ULO22771.1 host attachment family protein [Methylocystis sp. SB2]